VMPPAFKEWDASKLYSYFRIGHPILAMVPEEGSVAQILDEAETGWILPFHFNSLCNELTTIFEKWRKGEFDTLKPDSSYFRQYEQKELTKKLAGIFNRTIAHDSIDASPRFLYDEPLLNKG